MSVMSWWMWLLLWTGLVLVAAAFLAALLWFAWRRLLAALGELDRLGAVIERVGSQHPSGSAGRTRSLAVRGASDVFTPVRQARLKYREDSHRRRSERVERRIARRALRAQPQRVQDLHAARGKELPNG
ncbi:hypothetical protein [Kocuria palustris]|uniref:hypothetical protein n=1 Tax=Kocuria palustris TaxID=71999 RepID=UPI0024685776|nr:hypothetical protein [Kocuria palustris]MDH5150554.1 hypothetical protein [Kocuria palustris]